MNYWPASGSGANELMRTHFLGRIDALEQLVQRVRTAMAGPEAPPDWAITNLRSSADFLGDGLDPQAHAPLHAELWPRIESLRKEALEVAVQAGIRLHADHLRACGDEIFKSTRGAQSAIEDINTSVQHLMALQALDGSLAEAARRGKERAARYRWKKKTDDAEVAEAGGNAKKAAKLRAEAVVVLRQDWAMAFPGELAPEK